MTTTITYRCEGSVRGRCPHNHRTLRGAVACLRRDRTACKNRGGYSDRTIVPSDPREDTRELAETVADLLHPWDR